MKRPNKLNQVNDNLEIKVKQLYLSSQYLLPRMRILIYTAVHKRQEITELFLMGVKRLQMFSGHEISLFCVCSEQSDIDYLTSKGAEFCVHENKPLSSKMDFGFKQALKKDFDYMLRLGSDDLLDHVIFNDYYNKLMAAGVPYFGMKTIGVVEYSTLESIIYRYNSKDRILGGGSMLSRSLCLRFEDTPLYSKRPLNRGLDDASEQQIKTVCTPVSVTTKFPMLIDVKTSDNIHPFVFVAKRMARLPFETLTHFLSTEEDRYLRLKGAPFRVVAVIPVKGRLPLLKETISRLMTKNRVFKVICVGDGEDEKQLAESLGADFVHHANYPLGRKWNVGFLKAKEYLPDACLFVGSSDWISDNWIDHCEPYMIDYDMTGKPDFNLLDYGKTLRMCHWAGYKDDRRKGEPIGIGRLISRRILDKLGWQPMDPKLDSSLDYSMWQKVLNSGGKVKLITSDEIQSLSLSTEAWENKHKFSDHFANKKGVESTKMEPTKFLSEHFPEAFTL